MRNRRSAMLVALVLVLAWGSLLATLALGITPRLGLDLQGGTSVILTAPEGTDAAVLEKAVEIMRRRIEGLGGVQEPEIAIAGERNVIVQLPGVSDRERALEAVGSTGQLSFRPVLGVGPLPGISPLLAPAPEAQGEEGEQGSTTTTTLPPGVDPQTGLTISDDPNQEAWLLAEEDEGQPGLAYHVGPALVLGSDVADAQAVFDQSTGFGRWEVLLELTGEGARKFQEATKELAQFPVTDPRRQFAIVLDGVVVSAPQIAPEVDPNVGISGGEAVITLGGAGEAEARDLAVVLRYGALPVAFERSQVQSVSATLGSESLRTGLVAGLGGLVLVGLYMILYYRALGAVAVVGLTLFGSLVVVAFSLLGYTQGLTLTLAGVAGVIVSVGITADSFIVYFERMKEEVAKGRTLRSAVHHGFRPAFRTNLAGDTIAFLAAALLWLLAVGPVKGFAMALGMATILDVAVLYFFTRPAVALLSETRLGEGGAASMRAAVGRPVQVRA
ncbi:MAG: protein translocase subunit SecD [Actinomycetota bacterium]|nr:protein translocase subunit SecD [Actinomycetota bacterium]